MLNSSRVLNYVKSHLGFPFQTLELTDEQVMDHITTYTLREFSHYFPEVKRMNLSVIDTLLKVPNRQNEYYLEEPQGLEILNVVDVYFPISDLTIHGHPTYGPLSHMEMREWALQASMAVDTKMFSSFDKTVEFTHPNILRISPVPTDISQCTVEYERNQNPDFSGVLNEFQILFCELALADIMIVIGRIRKKYDGQMKTPWGEIPISSEVGDEGKEKKRDLLEQMKNGSPPNISIDIG